MAGRIDLLTIQHMLQSLRQCMPGHGWRDTGHKARPCARLPTPRQHEGIPRTLWHGITLLKLEDNASSEGLTQPRS